MLLRGLRNLDSKSQRICRFLSSIVGFVLVGSSRPDLCSGLESCVQHMEINNRDLEFLLILDPSH